MAKAGYQLTIKLPGRWRSYRLTTDAMVRLTTVVSMVLVAFALAQLTWWVISSTQTTLRPATSISPIQSGSSSSPPPVQLTDTHLFGQPQALPGSAINAPETTLDLTLRGIIAVDNQRVLAIIAQGGNEQPYKVGDTLPNGVILREILPTRVILERDGRFETLSLPKESLEQGEASPSTVTGKAASGAPIGQLREQLRNRPAEVLGLNAVQPVIENGQLKGYQLADNPYMPTLMAAGLKAGDMVTRINGIPVTDQSRVPEMLNHLSAASKITLELERGGVPMSLIVDMSR